MKKLSPRAQRLVFRLAFPLFLALPLVCGLALTSDGNLNFDTDGELCHFAFFFHALPLVLLAIAVDFAASFLRPSHRPFSLLTRPSLWIAGFYAALFILIRVKPPEC